jgi:hypothetical protein
MGSWEMNEDGKGGGCSLGFNARQAYQHKWRRVLGDLKDQGYGAIVYDLCSLVDLSSCSGDVLKE